MVSNRTVKVKINEISAPISITDADDFIKYFPDIALSLNAQSGQRFQLVFYELFYYKILSFSLSVFAIVF